VDGWAEALEGPSTACLLPQLQARVPVHVRVECSIGGRRRLHLLPARPLTCATAYSSARVPLRLPAHAPLYLLRTCRS